MLFKCFDSKNNNENNDVFDDPNLQPEFGYNITDIAYIEQHHIIDIFDVFSESDTLPCGDTESCIRLKSWPCKVLRKTQVNVKGNTKFLPCLNQTNE